MKLQTKQALRRLRIFIKYRILKNHLLQIPVGIALTLSIAFLLASNWAFTYIVIALFLIAGIITTINK